MDVPADAPAGTTQITVSGSGGGSASLPLDIEVSEEAAGSITMTTDVPSPARGGGNDLPLHPDPDNDTTQDQTFAVNATGPDGWVVNATLSGQAQAASAVIEAGATSNISVSAQAPEAAEAGSYPIQVLATVGDQSIDAELTVEITGTNLLTPTTPDQSLSNRGSAGGRSTSSSSS